MTHSIKGIADIVTEAGHPCWLSADQSVLLINADCSAVLPLLADGCVDAVVTDPPYGIGISSNPVRQLHEKSNWDNNVPSEDIFLQIFDLSRNQVIWGANYFNLPPHQCFLVWDKGQPENFSLAMCEMAYVSKKQPAKIFKKHVLSYSKEHPTQKPVELMSWCISFCDDAQTILDPFLGSGTTAVACVRLGRKCIGIELETKYFDIAINRVQQAFDDQALFTGADTEAVQGELFNDDGKESA